MKLVQLSPLRLSLEMEREELPSALSRLRAAVRDKGVTPQVKKIIRSSHAMIDVGGYKFIMVDDYGDLGLISTDMATDALLTIVAGGRRRFSEWRRRFRNQAVANVLKNSRAPSRKVA